jgi:hypothetical protein
MQQDGHAPGVFIAHYALSASAIGPTPGSPVSKMGITCEEEHHLMNWFEVALPPPSDPEEEEDEDGETRFTIDLLTDHARIRSICPCHFVVRLICPCVGARDRARLPPRHVSVYMTAFSGMIRRSSS